jgi:glycosyltransferase involved in cell wall biosynthesis
MKILHLANHCHLSGNGIVNVAVDLACWQSTNGHQTAFASAAGGYTELLARYGVQHFIVDQSNRAPWRLTKASAALLAVLRRFQPEIVHAHMMTGAVLGRMFSPWFSYRLVTTVHNEFQRSAILMGVGDRVIAISAASASALVRRGIARNKIRVVRNGVLGTPRLNRPASAPALALQHPAIVTVAGLNWRKGIADLIEAFDLVSRRNLNVHMYIVGDGPQRREFEAQARLSFGHPRVHFVGFVPDPRPYYQQADIFVLASHQEPFGLVLTEARQAGCAVVATDVGGIPEALDGGEAGILVPPHRADFLGSVLIRLLEAPTELDRLRRRARHDLERFTVSRASAQTLDVYRELTMPPAAAAVRPTVTWTG